MKGPEPQPAPQFLKRLLRKRKLSVSRLSRAASIDNSYLHRMLAGNRPISVDMSLRIASVLDLDPYAIALLQVRRQVFEHLKANENRICPIDRASQLKAAKS
jgi:plasmid maintenance system antidote protein VapI